MVVDSISPLQIWVLVISKKKITPYETWNTHMKMNLCVWMCVHICILEFHAIKDI